MKRVTLVGKYSDKQRKCHFEDIPIFLKMADLGENNENASFVQMFSVKPGSILIVTAPIIRWKMVMTDKQKIVVAFRTSNGVDKYPYIYKVMAHPKGTHELSLYDATPLYTPFERLMLYYKVSTQ